MAYFPEEEYAHRYAVLRAAMKKEGFDCLLVLGNGDKWKTNWGNLVYLGGARGFGPINYVLLPLFGELTYVGYGTPPSFNPIRGSVIRDIRLSPPLGVPGLLVDRLKELELENGRIGIVGVGRDYEAISMPLDHHQVVAKELPHLDFQDATPLFREVKAVKSHREVECVARAALLCDKAIELLVERLAPGKTERELVGAVQEAVLANGGEPDLLTILMAVPMSSPDATLRFSSAERPVDNGDIILNEIWPVVGESYYGAQCCKPISLGKPTSEYEDLFKIALEAYHALVETFRADKTTRDAAEAATRPYRKSGTVVGGPFIHGIGLQWEAPLVWPEWMPLDTPFQPGMTAVLHPWVYNKNKAGVSVGDTFVVTEGAPRRLTQHPAEITVKQ